MACGLPVVATRASGLEELVRDGVNGYLVNINDSGALADRIAALKESIPKGTLDGLVARASTLTAADVLATLGG